MADRGALSDVYQISFAEEATRLRGTPGAAFTPAALSALKPVNGENAIKPKHHLTSRKRIRKNFVGEKTYSLTGYCQVGDTFQADWDKILIAALGNKMVDVAFLTHTSMTATGFSFTGGPPAPIVLLTFDDGTKECVPVESYAAGAAVFAMQPVLGGRTISNIQNPIETTGALYYVDPTANTRSFTIHTKHGSEPDNKQVIGLGATITKLMLKVALEDVLGMDFQFDGVDWYPGPDTYGGVVYADTAADSGDCSNQFLSHMGVVYLQSTTAAPFDDVEAKGIEFDMAPTHINRRAITPKMPSGTNSVGSSVVGKRFGVHFGSGITLSFQFYEQSLWDAKRRDLSSAGDLQLFFEFFNGVPQGSASKRIAGWFPKVNINEQPTEEDDGGLVGQQLNLHVSERTLTGMTTSPFYLAFFGA